MLNVYIIIEVIEPFCWMMIMDVVNTGVVVRKCRLSEKSSNIEGVILGTICYVMYSKQYKRASFKVP